MSIFRLNVLFLCLLGGLPACQPDLATDSPVVVTAEPEFRVDAYEQRDSGTGKATLGLWVESIAVYECSGYTIESALRQTGQQIEIDLLDVRRPANCAGVSAPARQFVPIGPLAAGTYSFRLTLGKTIVNNGLLTVENECFALTLSQPQGMEVQNYKTQHLPDGLLWGYVSVPDEAANEAAQQFISEMKTITVDGGLWPGYYSYFTISGTGAIFLHSSIVPTGPVVLFVQKLTASPTELQDLLQRYRSGVQQAPLTLRCFSTFGEF